MIEFFIDSDGKWAYKVSDHQGVALEMNGFNSQADAMGDASRIAAALTAGYRDVRVNR